MQDGSYCLKLFMETVNGGRYFVASVQLPALIVNEAESNINK